MLSQKNIARNNGFSGRNKENIVRNIINIAGNNGFSARNKINIAGNNNFFAGKYYFFAGNNSICAGNIINIAGKFLFCAGNNGIFARTNGIIAPTQSFSIRTFKNKNWQCYKRNITYTFISLPENNSLL